MAYQLIDFGNSRKLESFDGYKLDRPCPAAGGTQAQFPRQWQDCDARFVAHSHHQGKWAVQQTVPKKWAFEEWFGSLSLSLTDFGHLGVFPEQISIWNWLRALQPSLRGMKLINLFAYTGGTTLAAASLGCEVAHVDAAKNIVKRASENARLSGLADRPIRWIVEDVKKYVDRLARRGTQFDGFVLDPPSFGHGTGTARWQINDDLPNLLGQLRDVCRQCKLMVLTCHSPGHDETVLRRLLLNEFAGDIPELHRQVETGRLQLRDAIGRPLPAGFFARWYCGADH